MHPRLSERSEDSAPTAGSWSVPTACPSSALRDPRDTDSFVFGRKLDKGSRIYSNSSEKCADDLDFCTLVQAIVMEFSFKNPEK